ncbi:hypothetical protein Tco_0436875, partial [Tanacetum coccineum]
ASSRFETSVDLIDSTESESDRAESDSTDVYSPDWMDLVHDSDGDVKRTTPCLT